MVTAIRDLACEMVLSCIKGNEEYHKYLNEFIIDDVILDSIGCPSIQVYIRFKPVGRGKKPNYVRFDIKLDRRLLDERVCFCWEMFREKKYN